MCGRFTNNANRETVKKEFKVSVNNADLFRPRYNIAPSQLINTVLNQEGERVISTLKWGLIPHWAKDADPIKGLINARSETLTEKPSFREAFQKRRCIIPASGFYEWKKGKNGKQPYYFYLNEKEVFGFAGLWEEWIDKQTGDVLETCTIITTTANDVLKPVHDRMPVILHSTDYDQWLDEKVKDTERLQNLLKPYPEAEMSSHLVSKSVNYPDTDSEELIAPLNSL